MSLNNLERDANGYLASLNDWSEDIATEIASEEGVSLTAASFKILNYLRNEYINNNQNQPNERNMVKGLKASWDGKLTTKELYVLFPKGPAKQAGKIAGLPETKRKGGY